MTEEDLKSLFENENIPLPDENAKKVALNLAVAEFEKNKKNAPSHQGSGFWARLIGKQPNQRSEQMSFSQKKVIYGGLATACVALLAYTTISNPTLTGSAGPSEEGQLAALKTTSLDEESDKLARSEEMVVADASSEMKKVKSEMIAPARKDAVMEKEIAPAESSVAPAQNMAMAGAAPQMMADRAVARPVAPVPASAAVGAVNGLAMAVEPQIYQSQQQEFGNDKFQSVEENAVKNVKAEPISTFSIDVDTASYSFARSSIDSGVLPQKDSIRIEEMVNYFDYDYPLPTDKEQPFSTNVVMKPSPWGAGKQLMVIGIKGYDIPKTQMPNSNLVFLLDVSGSMSEPNKLPLLKQSITMLLDTLKPTDTISIVVYAGAAGTVLQPTKVSDKTTILTALNNLQAGGSTAGAEGIRQAYQLAEQNYDKNAVNRVILGTDGDFNVGITNEEELKGFVEHEKDKGIFLSVLGFGRGNYNDEMMQVLAQNGNGVAAYIDSLNEARKVLVEEATKTLFPIAKDVKIQVEFNPATVAEYRLVGYETRALKTEDFNNDKVDAGDIGAGSEVTAIYEVTPVGGPISVDPSRYTEKEDADKNPDHSGELAFVKVRYKLPNEDTSKLLTTPVLPDTGAKNSALKSETNWAVAVASFAQLLKGGQYTGKMTYDDVIALANASNGNDPFGYRSEFISLVYKAKTAASLQPQPNGSGVVIEPAPVYPYPVPMSR